MPSAVCALRACGGSCGRHNQQSTVQNVAAAGRRQAHARQQPILLPGPQHLSQVEQAAALAIQLSFVQACRKQAPQLAWHLQAMQQSGLPLGATSWFSRCCRRLTVGVQVVGHPVRDNDGQDHAKQQLCDAGAVSRQMWHTGSLTVQESIAQHRTAAQDASTILPRTYAPCALHNNHNQRDAAAEHRPQHGGGPHKRIHARLQVQRRRQRLPQQQGQQRAKRAANQDAGPAHERTGSSSELHDAAQPASPCATAPPTGSMHAHMKRPPGTISWLAK